MPCDACCLPSGVEMIVRTDVAEMEQWNDRMLGGCVVPFEGDTLLIFMLALPILDVP